MTVKEIYDKLEKLLPPSLMEPWDNDGLMCAPDGEKTVGRVLVALDVTEEIVDYAIESHFDLILSHHPLIFRPLSSINEDNHVSRKIIKLLSSGISVFSFHSRADKAVGGVNDLLSNLLGIFDTAPFGEGDLGRIGEIEEECTAEDFAYRVKRALGSDSVKYVDALSPVRIVAVVGGDGKDFVRDAIAAGADTFVSGRLSYNVMAEGPEMGINLIEAGHFFTEQPIVDYFCEQLMTMDPDLYVEKAVSNLLKEL
jgi:dinuclear metal center YbgI/SA1388 family protein